MLGPCSPAEVRCLRRSRTAGRRQGIGLGKIAQKLTLESIVGTFVPRSSCVALGGLHFHNTPMAMVRELIRQGVEIDVLIPPIDGSINADQLIGAGLAREVVVAYVGLEIFGLAHRFRAAAEAGTIRVRDMEEAGFVLALAAGAASQPFAVLPPGFLPDAGPIPTVAGVNQTDYRAVSDPFTGTRLFAVRAITPDVALIHCQLIDRLGNCGFLGATFLDLDLARAARTCIVQAEEEVDTLPLDCRGYLPGQFVDAYCIVPGGAHPGSSHGLYAHDGKHIASYADSSRSDDGFSRYRAEIIGSSEDAYRAAAGVAPRLAELARRGP
jgi:glutaconate CoA-transferase subunit A